MEYRYHANLIVNALMYQRAQFFQLHIWLIIGSYYKYDAGDIERSPLW